LKTSKAQLIPGVYEASLVFTKSREHVQSPFRYPGGKYYALKYILPFLDAYSHDEYREPFVGGGSVFFGKRRAPHNWLNDLEPRVVEVYKAIQSVDRSVILAARVAKEAATRERHAEVKALSVNDPDDVAFQTYYLNRTSYSGIINRPAWGYAVGSSSPPCNWPRFIEGAHPKLKDVKLSCLDFEEVLGAKIRGKRALLYLDPPYFLADQKRAYTQPFQLNDHLRLERSLRDLKHAFLLSYDDCPEVRSLYKWAHIYEQSWFYNTANSSGPRKVGRELFITNYKVTHGLQLNLD